MQYKYKKRCPLCREWFIVENQSKIYCLKCKPRIRGKNADNKDN